VHALASNTTGSNNIAAGYHAGYNLTTGSNNIDIGSPGVAAESGVIRMGTITGTTSTQSATYIAGIYGVKTATAGTAVFIDSSGQLGTVSFSIRYKQDMPSNQLVMTQELIANMLGVRREGVTDAAGKLQKLGVIQYHRGHITVLDRPKLEHLSCECYRVVKKETDRLRGASSFAT
jgi:hypothetical protein